MKFKLQFRFVFPPICGIYDTGDGTIYIFGETGEDEIDDVISHETLHWAVQKVAGKKACLDIDNIDAEWLR